MIIGQKKLLNKIDTIENYPKFSIITGAKGSGKRTIVKYICNKLNLPMVTFGTSIDEVRKIIELSYEQDKPICYVCPDADSMSLGAKNALLKITEEPPNNAYFILTLLVIGNTLDTIKSRATVFSLDDYTTEEIMEYKQFRKYGNSFDDKIKSICSTTGEVDDLLQTDVNSFYTFAETVAFQIHLPTTGNIFKIPLALKMKEDEKPKKDEKPKYNPILLFKTVRNLYIKKGIEEKSEKYLKAASVTSACLRDLALPTVNKVGTVDKWIMDVRAVLR